MNSGTHSTTVTADASVDTATKDFNAPTNPNLTTTATTTTTTTAAATSGQSHPTVTKKKFGKNLNRLTAPPTAPVSQGGNKTSAPSKNGLLLLSNKRPSSGTNNIANSLTANSASNGGGGGGILSTKTTVSSSKPLPSLGLHTEYNPSTHDALMGVVVGASRMEAQQQPDAWGVAEKHQVVESVDLASPKPEVQQQVVASEKEQFAENRGRSRESDDDDQHHPGEFQGSNWDEYGGRNFPGDKDGKVGTGALVDCASSTANQGAFMSKLAKERSERRRGEEETRISAQKERAAQRLRDLEDKMASKEVSKLDSHPPHMISGDDRPNNSPYAMTSRERSSPRKLFDPNEPSKSYSSLVRGPVSTLIPHTEQNATEPGSNINNQVTTQKTMSTDTQSFQRNQEVIHLTSYDALDRGMRGNDTGPRMLFDPKSGSMVEVTSRDEGGEKKKKNNRRLKKKKTSGDDDGIEEVEPKSRNTRKDEGSGPMLGRGSGEAANVKPRRDNKKGKMTALRSHPRTCGVLFTRDKKGTLVSLDKCDGDLGYGVHSVPGGKIKNPDAYSVYVQNQKLSKSRNGSRNEKVVDSKDSPKYSIQESKQQPVLDWVKPNEKIELITGVDESPTLQATAREWAPSHQAYPTVEHKTRGLSISGSMDDKDLGEDDDDSLGLGFNPALNMDSMIQSPSIGPSDGLNAVDLASLSLEPALQTSNKATHNIFAFESGSTWANSGGAVTNDWSIPSGPINNGVASSSFLTLSSGNAWGGFGNHINGDHSSTNGD